MIYFEKLTRNTGISRFYKIWYEEAVQDGSTVWKLWTLRGRTGEQGTQKMEEYHIQSDFLNRLMELENLRLSDGYEKKSNPNLEQAELELS